MRNLWLVFIIINIIHQSFLLNFTFKNIKSAQQLRTTSYLWALLIIFTLSNTCVLWSLGSFSKFLWIMRWISIQIKFKVSSILLIHTQSIWRISIWFIFTLLTSIISNIDIKNSSHTENRIFFIWFTCSYRLSKTILWLKSSLCSITISSFMIVINVRYINTSFYPRIN